MTPKQREQYVLEFWPLAKNLVRNRCGKSGLRWEQIEDCCSAVTEEMIKAIDRYDSSKKATINTFVSGRIRYAIKDYFRQLPGGRFKKEKYEGRHSQAWERNRMHVFNFAHPMDIDEFANSALLSVNGTDKKIYNKDLVSQIFKTLDGIDGQEKRRNSRQDYSEIFRLYFMQGHTMSEIAEKKGCTKANISLTIKNTILKIRKHFEKAGHNETMVEG